MKSIFFFILLFTFGSIQSQTLLSALRMKGTSTENPFDLVEDGQGGIVVVSSTNSSDYSFQNSPAKALFGDMDIVLDKFDKNNVHQWQRRIGGSAYEISNEIDKDSKGNIYLGLQTQSPSLRIDSTDITPVSIGVVDGYVLKLSSTGKLLWSRRFGSTGNDEVRSVIVDKDDNVFVSGFYSADLILESYGKLVYQSGKGNQFLVKLSSTGEVLWANRLLGGSGNFFLSVDEAGNCYASGITIGKTVLDPKSGTEIILGTKELQQVCYLAKYSPSGRLIWAEGIVGPEPRSIDYKNGHIYLAGNVSNSKFGLFDPFNRTDSTHFVGTRSTSVSKYDTSGHMKWVHILDAKSSDIQLNNLGVDDNGNYYLTGTCSGTVDLDPLSPDGQLPFYTLIAAGFNDNRRLIWWQDYKGAGSTYGIRFIPGKMAFYFMAQHYGGVTLPFATGNQSWYSTGAWDSFVAIHSRNLITSLPELTATSNEQHPFVNARKVYLPASYNGTKIQLYSLAGREMLSGETSAKELTISEKIPSGLYILVTESNGGTYRRSVMVE